MERTRLRFGVLGTARIADAQVRAIRMSSNSELVAVASRDLGLAQAWARERDVPHAFGSYEEMLSSDAIDAVYIPLPNGLHKEWSVKAAQSGKHVLCEKPIAANAAEVEEMIAAAEANGVKMMEAFMYLFHPGTERLRQLLKDGAIGELKFVRATFGFLLTEPEDVRWSKELVGGSLMDVGSYCVSVARAVASAEPIAASAVAVMAPTGVDQSLAGLLEFPGGVLGMVDCSFQTGVVLQQSLVISGTEGRISVAQPFRKGDGSTTIVVDKADDPDAPGGTESVEVPGAYQYHLMVEHFADAVLNEHALAYTLHDSLNNMRAIDALREAARTGRRVSVQM